MSKQYLVRIKTVTGKTLYIDNNDTVWTKELVEEPYLMLRFANNIDWSKDDMRLIYIDDLEEAIDNAELYGGEVVECKFVIETVKRGGERNESNGAN